MRGMYFRPVSHNDLQSSEQPLEALISSFEDSQPNRMIREHEQKLTK
jgi:hypothetical protein